MILLAGFILIVLALWGLVMWILRDKPVTEPPRMVQGFQDIVGPDNLTPYQRAQMRNWYSS